MIWVIIPTYNEEVALPATLQHLFSQTATYTAIVVDGGSTDSTRFIAHAHSTLTLLNAPKGRASQMNRGATYVHVAGAQPHDWLLFLHADTHLPTGALQQLQGMEDDLTIQAGGFWHQFSGDDWRLRFISWLDNFRCQTSKIIYGDQAMFVRLKRFQDLGGFPNHPILEDVAFCEKLIQHVTPILLTPPVVTDSRKFIKMGIWRSLLRVFAIILCVEFRLPFFPNAFFQDVR